MKIDLRNVRCEWINVAKDTEKAEQMVELLDRLGFKNHQRFDAITGVPPKLGGRPGEENTASCGASHAAILKRAIEEDNFPIMILEDDIDVSEFPDQELDVPDGADALYLGTSHGDRNYTSNLVEGHDDLIKITQVFATHAILYLNKNYAKEFVAITETSINSRNHHFDVSVAYNLQPRFEVYGMRVPIFYQADAKNSTNKWEHLTKTPLEIRPKKTMWKTVGM
jgi:hypothetical protein